MRILPLIEENKDFIAEEAILYFLEKHPNYYFDKEFCRRDVHMICDIICGDLNLEGFISPISYASPYIKEGFYNLNRYKGSFLCFREQNEATLDVMSYVIDTIKLIAENKNPILKRGTYNQIKDPRRCISKSKLEDIDLLGSLIASNAGSSKKRSKYTELMEEYFDKGFIHTTIPEKIYSKLWDHVNNTNWVDATLTTYKKRPDWYHENKKYYLDPTMIDRPIYEKEFANDVYTNAPPEIIQTSYELIKEPIFDFLKTFRPPNPVTRCVHLWNGSENSPHHCDGVDGTDLMIFCYLTDEEGWNEEWGGYINMLKEVNGEFYHTKNIMPIDGTMVIVNNSNPIFKHGIRDLKYKDKNRYTFIFHYTWTF
jgi:hypothetical protein